MRRSSTSLIAEAIACVAREVPRAHARMRTALGGRRVELVIGSEALLVELEPAEPRPAITVRTSLDTLCAVLAGELDVLDAILALRLEIVGDPDALAAAGEALTWFLQGAMRCISIEPLAGQLFALRTEEAP
jgi:hypothetical protein